MLKVSDNKGNSYTMPTRVSDLTLGHAIALEKLAEYPSDLAQVAALSGIPREVLETEVNVASYTLLERAAINLSESINKRDWDGLDLPARIDVGGKSLCPPREIGRCTALQYESMKTVLKGKEVPSIEDIATIASIYLQPIVDDSTNFNPDRVESVLEALHETSLRDVIGVGNFFFRLILTTKTGISRRSQKRLKTALRRRQALAELARSLGRFTPWRRSQTLTS